MRFFTVLPATLLAISSFVSAVPAAGSAVSARDDSSIQSLIDAFNTASTQLQPLQQKFAESMKASPQDASDVNSEASEINNVIMSLQDQVKGTNFGAMTPSEATEFKTGAISSFDSVEGIVSVISAALQYILAEASPAIIELVDNLLALVDELTDCLHDDVAEYLPDILGPLMTILNAVLVQLPPIVAALTE